MPEELDSRSKPKSGTVVIEDRQEIVLPEDWMDYFVRRLAALSARQSEADAEAEVHAIQADLAKKQTAK